MERDEEYIKALKEWLLKKKDNMYNNFLKNETGNPTDLARYENELMILGNQLLKALESENLDDLRKLGWPEKLIECIRDPSVNLVIHDFIQLACIRFPNSNSVYSLDKLKAEQNIGLE